MQGLEQEGGNQPSKAHGPRGESGTGRLMLELPPSSLDKMWPCPFKQWNFFPFPASTPAQKSSSTHLELRRFKPWGQGWGKPGAPEEACTLGEEGEERKCFQVLWTARRTVLQKPHFWEGSSG